MKQEKIKWGEDPVFFGPRDWFMNDLIIREIVSLKKGGKLLDFGCGSGFLLQKLVSMGFVGVGIDDSKLVIDNFKIDNNKTVYIKGNENHLYLNKYKESFDVIVAKEVLEHIANVDKLVDGFFLTLKKDGICVISVPAHMSLWDLNDDASKHLKRYEASSLKKIFIKAGFKIKRVYYFGFPLCYLWHRFVYLPTIKNKLKKKIIYTHSGGLLKYIISQNSIKRMFSYIFWFDQLFNWTNKGIGLILVAEKIV